MTAETKGEKKPTEEMFINKNVLSKKATNEIKKKRMLVKIRFLGSKVKKKFPKNENKNAIRNPVVLM